MLHDVNSAFASCLALPQILKFDFPALCIADSCAVASNTDFMKQAACGVIAAVDTMCKENGFNIEWRNTAGCRESVSNDAK
jgi:hypothetical protein